MADQMTLTIVTADGVAYEGKVNYVNLPTPDGSVGILAGHAPMLCAVAEGELKYRSEEEGDKVFTISSGIAEIMNNVITVLLVKSAET